MFKKLSYLASVSVLASVVMAPAHAVFEEELSERIQAFVARKSNPQVPAVQEDQRSWAQTIGNGICDGLYHGAGFVRDWADSSSAQPLLEDVKEYGISQAKAPESSWGLVGKALEYVQVGAIANSLANTTRTLASLGVSQTTVESEDTIERAIRSFWKEKQYQKKATEVFTSTACALLMQPGHISNTRAIYHDFATLWNKGARNVALSAGEIDECLLKGALRYYARSNMDPTNNISVLKINNLSLPPIAAITAETVFPDPVERNKKSIDTIKQAVKEAQDTTFQEVYLDTIYASEVNEVSYNKCQRERYLLLKGFEQKAIEPAEGIEAKNELGQSLLMAPEPKEDERVEELADSLEHMEQVD